MTAGQKGLAQFLIIIDFSIKYKNTAAILIGNRLIALAGKVNDFQTTKAQ